MTRFGQGDPESPIWFIGEAANFPVDIRDIQNLADYFVSAKKRRDLGSRFLPHPLFHYHWFYSDSSKTPGVAYWSRLLGVSYSRKNILVDKNDTQVIKIKPLSGRSGLAFYLWMRKLIYSTEVYPEPVFHRPEDGLKVSHDIRRLIRSQRSEFQDMLDSHIKKFNPNLIITLGKEVHTTLNISTSRFTSRKNKMMTFRFPTGTTKWQDTITGDLAFPINVLDKVLMHFVEERLGGPDEEMKKYLRRAYLYQTGSMDSVQTIRLPVA